MDKTSKAAVPSCNSDICNTIYQASGNSVDSMYDLGAIYSFGIELRDTGRYGFTLPAQQIVPSGEETTNAVLELFKYIAKNQ
jgi:hypothetical protein